MLAGSVDEAASIVRRVADEMSSANERQLIGTDCITVDPTQVRPIFVGLSCTSLFILSLTDLLLS